ncbi:maleylpyruvate isomerase family mycothiol-dependent enzyme [Pseudactinotalea terrae]|uniref:maleylpyruvate isomerase family mycothiol-dependent enzyme n=1 Tax=Pseudactinotalea terrae TaxID=1743262 RepID=UPI0012E25813|nr:maleylpyruvate isomerase family mycothiol-dependent enzyme [Pseudactinotalea terrae]
MTTTEHTHKSEDLSAQYRALADRITSLLEGTDIRMLRRSSPCEGWDGTDVLEHLVTTQRDFLSSHVTMPGLSATEPLEQWHEHVSQVEALLAEGTADTEFDGYFGPTTIGATLARFYGFDMIVHRWDIGQAVGVDVPWDEAELEQVETSIAGFGDHLYAEGICNDPLEVADGATKQERLLALLGRRPVGGLA